MVMRDDSVKMMGSCRIHMNYETKPLYNPHSQILFPWKYSNIVGDIS